MAASLGIGLLGLGTHGSRYARHLAAGQVPGAHLAAIWTRAPVKAGRFAHELKVQAAATPSELVTRSDVDAVAIVVPVGLHLALVEAAARAGKPVLVEKPLAPTPAIAARMRAAMAAAGLPFSVAQTLRFDPLLERLRRAASVAERGPLVGFALEQRLEPRGLAWEDDPDTAGGGVLLQTGVHLVDALLHVIEPDEIEVEAAGASLRFARRTEDEAWVRARLRGGRSGSAGAAGLLATSKVGGSRHHRILLLFEGGGIEADWVDRRFSVTTGRERATRVVPPVPTVVRTLSAFAAYVRGEAENPVPPEEAERAIGVIANAYDRMDPRPGQEEG